MDGHRLGLQIDLVRLPFLVPFTTSFGTEKERNALILRLESGGVVAFSECVTSVDPSYSYEDNATALHIIRDHLAKLAGDIPEPAEFIRRAEGVRGHNMAKAAVEMLLWDYQCKVRRVSLSRALGPSRGYAEVGVSIGMDRIPATLKRVGDAIGRGYKRVKVKIERGREYEIVSSVRDAHPDVPLSADANSCYTIKDTRLLKRLDRFDLVYLEQPLGHDDILDHSKLAREISTPICLDESITSVERARQAFEVGAAQVINVKPGRIGGLVPSLRVARVARRSGGHAWVGGMLETGVGRAFNVALASSRLIDYPGDTSPNDRYFARDIVKNPFRMTDGRIGANDGPGIGVELDEEHLRRSTVKSWKIS